MRTRISRIEFGVSAVDLQEVMATFKLTYLNYRGRAELIRFILSHAGIKFEDIRLAPEKWSELRQCMSK